jgi:hypothetical protein
LDISEKIAKLPKWAQEAFFEAGSVVKDWCRCDPKTATWEEQIDGEKKRTVRCPKHWPVVEGNRRR